MNLNLTRLVAVVGLVVFATPSFVPLAWAQSKEQENSWVLAAKPSAVLLATGGGLEIGRELSDSSTLSLNAEIDHFLVGGTSFIGITWRQRIWNGLYLQGGPGVTEFFFHSFSEQRPGAFVVGGWEFSRTGSVQPGIEFGGGHFAVDDVGNVISAPAFPKFRLSFRL